MRLLFATDPPSTFAFVRLWRRARIDSLIPKVSIA